MKYYQEKPQTCGIALGGLGTGSVELFPDGEFHEWQIYNTARWADVNFDKVVDDGEQYTGALSFWLRTELPGEEPIVRKLGMKTDSKDFTYRMYAWNRPVEGIEFDGRFPIADLHYISKKQPCDIRLKAVSPFVPHDSETSSVPGFYLDFSVKNTADKPLKISLLGRIDPAFIDGETVGAVTEHGGHTILTLSPKEDTGSRSSGAVAFSMDGGDGETTYLTSDHRAYLHEYVSGSEYGTTQESFLFDFRRDGVLPNSSCGVRPEEAENIPDEIIEAMEEAELRGLFDGLMVLPSFASIVTRIRHTVPEFPNGRKEFIRFIRYWKWQRIRMGEGVAFGAGAMCRTVTLNPGESVTVHAALGWYFPHHTGKDGKVIGHYYENRFADVLSVSRYLCDEHDRITTAAKQFAELLFRTDLPSCYPEAWSLHLSTLVKDSWWIKDGRFGLWEGLGYCGFHTTDITYHASFGLLALFPELQKRQMRMGLDFQREDGRVHHFFTPDMDHVDDGYDRVDMNMQFVMMAYRDVLWTGDETYGAQLWPYVCRAMDSIEALDTDGDGLPDTDTSRNTYDAWSLDGTPCYIAILWVSALYAAEKYARRMGDAARAEHWRGLLAKGNASLETLLWNGRYYHLWVKKLPDGTKETDACLMTDQLDGEWFLRTSGIGSNLPDERVSAVTDFILSNNYDEETGLINARCLAGEATTLHTYKNCQAEAQWTGIGYLFSALISTVGSRDWAQKLIETMHRSQSDFGYFWNHWECGFRYTRPLSSWSTLNCMEGLAVDADAHHLTVCPPVGGAHKAPLFTSSACGSMVMEEDCFMLTCTEGKLELASLRLPFVPGRVTIDTVPVDFAKEDGAVRLASLLTLEPGMTLICRK
ncbi:MAG: hypothetical protein MJ175_00320 [Clostridia bacterium]|nr:hypothetical protein [Clostridia bacterium]